MQGIICTRPKQLNTIKSKIFVTDISPCDPDGCTFPLVHEFRSTAFITGIKPGIDRYLTHSYYY